jgi:acetate kinase
VGHRIVHGGPDHAAPVLLDPALRRSLDGLIRFAPLHLPAELAFIDAVSARWPGVPQVACFDTAFHRGLPEVAERLPLPRELFDAGVRRYGFHGLSYEFVVDTIGAASLGRAVIAHLGNGASMAAVVGGRSIDTTMGFTPTGGLMMGTRAGDLDPGVLVHLMDHRGADAREIGALVNTRSGLLGVSGTTSDVKALLEASPTDPRAALAIEMFCYSARKFIGALTAALGGLDSLVFTGGIGEHAAPVRERICAGLGYLGVRLDAGRNQRAEGQISVDNSPCRVFIVRADEERMIARHVGRVIQRGSEVRGR